jgi:Spy/CpxP family protein refolding chaperone
VKRLEMIIVAGFIIMFVAGLAVGLTLSRFHTTAVAVTPPEVPAKADDHFHTLGRELNLTPEQKQKMEAVWKDSHVKSDKSRQAIAEEDKTRDAAIHKLFSAELQEEYDRLQHEHEMKVGELRSAIWHDMHETNEKIRALLTPTQRQKFDQIAKEHHHHGPPPMGGPTGPGPGFGPHRFHGPRHGPDTATSRPESAPTN